MKAQTRRATERGASACDGARAQVHGADPVRAIPEWLCACGARNRLRDTACRNCGAHKPEV